MGTTMIDILIPTYNRVRDLINNILHIDSLLKCEELTGKYRLLISNNASTDTTSQELAMIKENVEIEIQIYEQISNIGLEKNAVFVLEKATSEYVLFLGDDDFFPNGYLKRLAEIAESKEYGVVIPGFSQLWPDGSTTVGRADSITRWHEPGFYSVLDLSGFGHQLSGLFFLREGVVEAYKADLNNRNIYLFIFFIGYVMKRKKSLYLSEYKMLVTQGNVKDWRYDASGLLDEMFKNYNALYKESRICRILLCAGIMKKQNWRMRVGRNPLLAIKSMINLIKSNNVDVIIKYLLPLLYTYLYFLKAIELFRKKHL